MAKQIKIEFTVDLENKNEVLNLIDMLHGFLPEGYVKEEETEEEEEEAEEAPAKTKKKAPVKAASKKAPVKVEEEAEEEAEGEAEESDIKIEDVRALLAKKVNDNRDAIKAKLTELGANNVTSLESSNYPKFMEFLNGLK